MAKVLGKKKDRRQELVDWDERIVRAERVHEEWLKEFKVIKGREFFAGDQKPDHVLDKDHTTSNKIYSNVVATLPSLSINPHFYVTLQSSYDVTEQGLRQTRQRAEIREGMLNYVKDQANLEVISRLAQQDRDWET